MARFFHKLIDVPNPKRSKETTSMKHAWLKNAPILFGLAALVACGSDSTAPKQSVAGTYVATQWVTTGSSGQTDQLLAGSGLFLSLGAHSSLAGQLHLAATNSDTDMAGTWTQAGNTITFAQEADTFVRNMTFDIVPDVNRWQLVGVGGFSGTQIQITLTQQPTM
jgi:hypothetical protein